MPRVSAVSPLVLLAFAGLGSDCTCRKKAPPPSAMAEARASAAQPKHTSATCSSYAYEACARACACSRDSRCRIRSRPASETGTGHLYTFPSKAGCVQAFGNAILKCGDKVGVDYGTCVEVVSPGACVDEGDGVQAIGVWDPCN